MSQTTPATAQNTSAPRTNLTIEQVQRILTSRRFIDHSHVGMEITQGLRIVGSGQPTKDAKRVVYNTNAMRKDAMVLAMAHVRNAKMAIATGATNDEVQEALTAALNEGVITFSLDASWTQFPANSSIHARVDSFTIKSGPQAGQTGIGIGSVRLAPTVALKSEAALWNFDDEPAVDGNSVPSTDDVTASQIN